MTSLLQLTEQRNPAAQTFVVEADTVLTGIGIFFATADATFPITLELRPTIDAGSPSAKRFVSGSRITVSAADIASVASTTFSAATEYKFTFPEPQFIPSNSLVSFVLYTSAPVGNYTMYTAKNGEFLIGTTTKRYSSISNTNDGSFYGSSNGTTWTGDNNKDFTFKAYRAEFTANQVSRAKILVNSPPLKQLTETNIDNNLINYTYDPLVFTRSADSMGVIHPSHGFLTGDKVVIKSIGGFDSGDTINGVSGASLLGTKTILSVDPYGYRVAIGSAADSSVRAGGTGLFVSEQYVINEFQLNVPLQTPKDTVVRLKGDFTTTTSFGNAETAYGSRNNIRLENGVVSRFPEPHVIANVDNEVLRLSGGNSTVIRVNMETTNTRVAPYFNIDESLLITRSNFIDYQQSDSGVAANRNYISTVDYVPETSPDGGTTASKHLTVPYYLENTSTSIVVLVDAVRPIGADFSVWYRTANSSNEIEDIEQQYWTEFSKINKATIISGNLYSEIAPHDVNMVEYEFAQFNIDAFDTYQIKITMNSTRSSYAPLFTNLRIIATSD
jgi:hypothetical protein